MEFLILKQVWLFCHTIWSPSEVVHWTPFAIVSTWYLPHSCPHCAQHPAIADSLLQAKCIPGNLQSSNGSTFAPDSLLRPRLVSATTWAKLHRLILELASTGRPMCMHTLAGSSQFCPAKWFVETAATTWIVLARLDDEHIGVFASWCFVNCSLSEVVPVPMPKKTFAFSSPVHVISHGNHVQAD